MNISTQWLRDLIDLELSAQEMADRLSVSGLEVEHLENWESLPGGLRGFVIGQVLTCEKHPNADKLSCTTVDVGAGESLSIVCGAPNVAAGQKVVVATVGSEICMPGKEPFLIGKSKIRGEVSEGMICAEDEMGLGNNHDGIMVLPDDVSVGMSAADYFGIVRDQVMEIGLTANRGDAASHLGVARDLAALFGAKLRPTAQTAAPGESVARKIVIENGEDCRRYRLMELTGAFVKASSTVVQNRLLAIGLEPKNNLVDCTNYVLHETGQPVHAFDADKVAGDIQIRLAKSGETLVVLGGTELKLNIEDLVIADDNGPIALAGVMGGLHSAVNENTQRILVEVADFHPTRVRKSAKRHTLNTDASFRFERGIDRNAIPEVASRLAFLMQRESGAEWRGWREECPVPFEQKYIALSLESLNRFAGYEIERETVSAVLSGLGFGLKPNPKGFEVAVPAWRNDIEIDVDLYEEVMRIDGFDKVPMSGKMQASLGAFSGMAQRKRLNRVRHFLAGAGWNEASTNSLTSASWYKGRTDLVELTNPLSSDMAVMRASLVPGLLQSLAFNAKRQADRVQLFEIGKTYHKTENGFKETPTLCIAVWGRALPESWENGNQKVGYYDLQKVALGILAALRSKARLEDFVIGQASATWCKQAELKGEAWTMEIPLKKLLAQPNEAVKYQAPAKFPTVRRDLSLVVDKAKKFADLESVIKAQKVKILRDTRVFDIYEGKPLEANQKAVSLSFFLSRPDATLTDKEADAAMEKLMKAFEESGALIRR
ncbi:MAG: phenylalanine--tRNA ligase subunit beta [Bacteroidetes bacterium]|nr:phenylalanine--tRNA ligase subunit beta [Bacteroidota bacterium]